MQGHSFCIGPYGPVLAKKTELGTNIAKKEEFRLSKKEKNIEMNSPEFYELQRKWYKKLKSSGFDDLEWTGPKGQQSDFFKKKSLNHFRKQINEGLGVKRLFYYSVLENFLRYNPRWVSKEERWKTQIVKMHLKGISYRKMVELQKKKRLKGMLKTKSFSIFIVFQVMREFVRKAFDWNTRDQRGLKIEEVEKVFYVKPFTPPEY